MNNTLRNAISLAVALIISHTVMDMLGYENYRIFVGWHMDASWEMKQTAIFTVVFCFFFFGILQLWKLRNR